ncbi:Txe/YoeB family addiction module toxin [Terrimonas pollutisoli]|uniref:Txe/YoeB family addiction module toxin n=1 Tax=Terrimonas pollutisoli TaxID=3034147 RepID=UPI0023ED1D25|nr:Txe/YoeB family addiction module toxin [Terrimonas sp. H1YJ31]
MRNVAFTPVAFQEYNEWFEANEQLVSRIKTLIRDTDRDPFRGIGKPEPLKGNWTGYWSRRIDQEHRLIYKVSDSQILIAKCKGHY